MKQLSEDDLNKMLFQARHRVADPAPEDAFENILKKAAKADTTSAIRFTQLRNTGIALLLVLAVNVFIVSTAGNKNPDKNRQAETTQYLQPYNLNVY